MLIAPTRWGNTARQNTREQRDSGGLLESLATISVIDPNTMFVESNKRMAIIFDRECWMASILDENLGQIRVTLVLVGCRRAFFSRRGSRRTAPQVVAKTRLSPSHNPKVGGSNPPPWGPSAILPATQCRASVTGVEAHAGVSTDNPPQRGVSRAISASKDWIALRSWR